VWSSPLKWEKYKQYLATISEGEDSDGKPLTMARYATFLELYAKLDYEYRRGTAVEELAKIVLEDIAGNKEGFLDRERCLRCVDSGMRREVLLRIEKVRKVREEAGPQVFILVYPRVVDKLGELLGTFQNILISQNKQET